MISLGCPKQDDLVVGGVGPLQQHSRKITSEIERSGSQPLAEWCHEHTMTLRHRPVRLSPWEWLYGNHIEPVPNVPLSSHIGLSSASWAGSGETKGRSSPPPLATVRTVTVTVTVTIRFRVWPGMMLIFPTGTGVGGGADWFPHQRQRLGEWPIGGRQKRGWGATGFRRELRHMLSHCHMHHRVGRAFYRGRAWGQGPGNREHSREATCTCLSARTAIPFSCSLSWEDFMRFMKCESEADCSTMP